MGSLKRALKNKKFVTLYYKGVNNAYLVKDIGQIPYFMHKKFGYEAVLLGHQGDHAYPLLQETPGLKLEFVDKGKKIWRLFEMPTVRYLINHSKEIDVLNIYFAKGMSLVYGLIYKWVNPKGILYIKLDANLDLMKSAKSCFYPTRNVLKKILFSFLVPVFFKKVDLFSVEQKAGLELARKFHPKHADKFIYLPNGVSESFFHASENNRGFGEKENIILTVGRIGIYEKNSEMLLEALQQLNLKNWKVVFIGPITAAFQERINHFYRDNPGLKDNVLFTGAIYEREKLLEWFDRAKVFCLTSRRESFGIVLGEAMLYHNYILTTDVSSANDITDSGRLGTIIPSENGDALVRELQNLIDDESMIAEKYDAIRDFAIKNFNWENILIALDEHLREIKINTTEGSK